MGDVFSSNSNVDLFEDVLTEKKIKSDCPTAFKETITNHFHKATSNKAINTVWKALVKLCLQAHTAESLYFIGRMHKARKKNGADLKTFLDTLYDETVPRSAKHFANIVDATALSLGKDRTATPAHWPGITDAQSLDDSLWEVAERSLIILLAENSVLRLKRQPAMAQYLGANEDYDNELEFYDEFYDNELEQARGEYIDGGINGYNVGYRQGYNKGYNFGKNIGYGNNHGVTDPIIYLLISVMLCVCLLLCGVLTNVISCAVCYVFGKMNTNVKNEHENKNEYENINQI